MTQWEYLTITTDNENVKPKIRKDNMTTQTKEQMLQHIKDMEKELESMRKLVTTIEEENPILFIPKAHETYYVSEMDGRAVKNNKFTDMEFENRKKYGMFFKTEQEASDYCVIRRIHNRLRELSRHAFTIHKVNHYLYVNLSEMTIGTDSLGYCSYGGVVFFATRIDAENARDTIITEFGKEMLIKYLTRV